MRAQPQTLELEAFAEYKVTRQTSTGNGDLYCAQWRPFPGFRRHELGYDGPVGVRLYSMVPQETLDQRHQDAAQGRIPAPAARKRKRKQKRETKHSRSARLAQLEVRALAMRWDAA